MEEKRYKVIKTDVIDPKIDSPEWDKANEGKIESHTWMEFYQDINTTFKMLRGPEGISVKMHTNEKNLRSECKEQNGMVCYDSCMEFFFKPSPWDLRYLNFEFNPDKVLHLGLGAERRDRMHLTEDREIFSIESIPNDGDWTIKFYIPDEFLHKYFEKTADVCKANFYKCGELTGHSHFITWSKVETEKPDFHVADFFGRIEF